MLTAHQHNDEPLCCLSASCSQSKCWSFTSIHVLFKVHISSQGGTKILRMNASIALQCTTRSGGKRRLRSRRTIRKLERKWQQVNESISLRKHIKQIRTMQHKHDSSVAYIPSYSQSLHPAYTVSIRRNAF